MDNNLPNSNNSPEVPSTSAAAPVAIITPTSTPPVSSEPIPTPPAQQPIKKSKKGMIIIIAIILLVLIGGGVFAWMYMGNSEQKLLEDDRLKAEESQDPYQEFEAALDKTLATKSFYSDFKSTVTTKIASADLGITETTVSHVDGYVTGITRGETKASDSKAQMQIYSEADPTVSIVVDVISTADGISYIKGPTTGGKWLQQTEEELNDVDDKTPTDASLYGFELLFGALSEDKLLFKEINKETFRRLGDEVVEGKTLERYEVEIDIPAYIAALEANEDANTSDIEDAKAILKNAALKSTFFVDNATGYIVNLSLDAKNLTQIITEEYAQYGISSTHDVIMTAELSRFNLDVDVTPPPAAEILNPSLQTFNTQNPLTSDVLGLNKYRFDQN